MSNVYIPEEKDEIDTMPHEQPVLDKLATALAKAQSAMGNAVLNKMNPHFKSKYADLASVREATLPALTANGLAIVDDLPADDRVPIRARIAKEHVSAAEHQRQPHHQEHARLGTAKPPPDGRVILHGYRFIFRGSTPGIRFNSSERAPSILRRLVFGQ